MPTTFDELLISTDYSAIATGGPEWATAIVRSGEGGAVAHRNANLEDYISKYEIKFDDLNDARLKTLRDFAILRQGKARGFRFLAPDDSVLSREPALCYNSTTGQFVTGTTDGARTEFYLFKNYSDPFISYGRRIIKPSPYKLFTFEIYDADDAGKSELIASGGIAADTFYRTNYEAVAHTKTGNFLFLGFGVLAFTLDFWQGKLTFSAPLPAGHLIFCTGQYHLPVAFGDDWAKFSVDEFGSSNLTAQVEEILPVELNLI